MKKELFCIICSTKLMGNQMKYCSGNCKQKDHYKDVTNNPNTCYNQTKRAIKRKIEFIKLLGNECSLFID